MNARTSLAEGAIKAKRHKTDKEDESDGAKQQKAPQGIRVDLLTKYKFDLKNRVGFIVWREDRLGFNSLRTLQHAYTAAFGPIAQAWFTEPEHTELAYLEAKRQVIVHRGGKVDEYFLERVGEHPVLSKLKAGDPLVLDGQVAADSAELAMNCCYKLLDHVDAWLVDNPEPL